MKFVHEIHLFRQKNVKLVSSLKVKLVLEYVSYFGIFCILEFQIRGSILYNTHTRMERERECVREYIQYRHAPRVAVSQINNHLLKHV